MGPMFYRAAVAFREWGERAKCDPAITLGKFATGIICRIVRVGGKPKARHVKVMA